MMKYKVKVKIDNKSKNQVMELELSNVFPIGTKIKIMGITR